MKKIGIASFIVLVVLLTGCFPGRENPKDRDKFVVLSRAEVLQLKRELTSILVVKHKDSLRINELKKLIQIQNSKNDNTHYRSIIVENMKKEIEAISGKYFDMDRLIQTLKEKIKYHRGELTVYGVCSSMVKGIVTFIIIMIFILIRVSGG